MKFYLSFILLFLFSTFNCWAEDPKKELKISMEKQADFDQAKLDEETKNLVLSISPPHPKDGEGSLINLENLSEIKELQDVEILYAGESFSSFPIWETLNTLPSLEAVEKISVSPRANIYSFPQPPEGKRQLWDFLSQRFPNMKKLNLNGFYLSGVSFEEEEKEDTLEQLAIFFPD